MKMELVFSKRDPGGGLKATLLFDNQMILIYSGDIITREHRRSAECQVKGQSLPYPIWKSVG
jgi:hypothetical protein